MVRLHAADLPTAFHTMLGAGFLRQLFLAQVRDPACVALVAERDGEVVGYASAMASMRAFRRRFLLRQGMPAALAAAPSSCDGGCCAGCSRRCVPRADGGVARCRVGLHRRHPAGPPGVGTELCRGLSRVSEHRAPARRRASSAGTTGR